MRVQRISTDDGAQTWTVLGPDHLPIEPVESYLESLRQMQNSPNTVRAYARALALWSEYLDRRDIAWDRFSLEDFAGFLGWMRFGHTPDVAPLKTPDSRVSNATLALRLQAVRSFYLFHEWHGLEGLPSLLVAGRQQGRFIPFLGHLRRDHQSATLRVKVARRRAIPPTLTPNQIAAIKDDCATYDPAIRGWRGSVRDRLLFSVLEETGLRLGELLSLQHRDWHSGAGESPYLEVVPRPHPLGMRVKGGNYRKLYISGALDKLYADYLWHVCELGLDLHSDDVDRTYVFVNVAAGELFAPMRPETVYKLVARIKRHLGDRVPKEFSPHWFRHTHATALLLSGAQTHTVSRRLGHAQVQTTLDIYAWVMEDEELRSLADWNSVTREWKGRHEDP